MRALTSFLTGKARKQAHVNYAWADVPGFEESLRLLVYAERYATEDIGMMFGVSRQRVDQWLEARGIVHPDPPYQRGSLMVRVWDDVACRFRPVRRRLVEAERRVRDRVEREAAREARRRVARSRMVVVAVRLRVELQREPTNRELYEAITGRVPAVNGAALMLACLWDARRTRSYRERITEFRAAAGLVGRGRGGRLKSGAA